MHYLLTGISYSEYLPHHFSNLIRKINKQCIDFTAKHAYKTYLLQNPNLVTRFSRTIIVNGTEAPGTDFYNLLRHFSHDFFLII
jgi:hypothetical protein